VDSTSRYLEPAIETMPRPQLEQLQLDRLMAQVEYSYSRSALVHDTWRAAGVTPADITSLADYQQRAPFIDKDMIRRWRARTGDPYGGMLCVDPAEVTTAMSTSGTTGDATLLPRIWRTSLPESDDLARHCWEMGVRDGDYAVYMAMTIRGPLWDAYRAIGAKPLLFEHNPAELERLCQTSLDLRPTGFFVLSPPLILALEELAGRIDLIDVFASYRGVIYGGEPLGARAAGLLADWGVPVFNHTSNADIGFANECAEHDGNHVWEDLSFVEQVDVSGDEAPNGRRRGELVATALVDKAAPLIRYRSGDVVEFTKEPCGCGRTHARFWPVGRVGDQLVVAGRAVLPSDITPLLESQPETAAALFQFIRPHPDDEILRLRVGHNETRRSGSVAELRGRLETAIGAALDAPVEVEVELVENADLLKLGPPHKIPRIASR
jgi:phenylacetate-CoA ligase